jgi:two-component system cell cycle response regulator CpdR
MGQSTPYQPLALVVEDDLAQRFVLCSLLEDKNLNVIQCESAEAAERVLEKVGAGLSVMVTDVDLAGTETGLELATRARDRFPDLLILVVSGSEHNELPRDVSFLRKPYRPLDVLREVLR